MLIDKLYKHNFNIVNYTMFKYDIVISLVQNSFIVDQLTNSLKNMQCGPVTPLHFLVFLDHYMRKEGKEKIEVTAKDHVLRE